MLNAPTLTQPMLRGGMTQFARRMSESPVKLSSQLLQTTDIINSITGSSSKGRPHKEIAEKLPKNTFVLPQIYKESEKK